MNKDFVKTLFIRTLPLILFLLTACQKALEYHRNFFFFNPLLHAVFSDDCFLQTGVSAWHPIIVAVVTLRSFFGT